MTKYNETCLSRTLSKPKTCLQTNFTVSFTKCLCNFNLCKPNTCLNWTNSWVPRGLALDRFYCNWLGQRSKLTLAAHSSCTELPFQASCWDFPACKNDCIVLTAASINLKYKKLENLLSMRLFLYSKNSQSEHFIKLILCSDWTQLIDCKAWWLLCLWKSLVTLIKIMSYGIACILQLSESK